MTTKAKTKDNGNKGPAYQKRVGAVRGSVWTNENDGRVYFNTSLVRRYKDGEEWKEVSSFNGTADIVAAQEVLRCCLHFIHQQEDAESVGNGDE